MHMKNLSSLSYGLFIRLESGIKVDDELTDSLLKAFILKQ